MVNALLVTSAAAAAVQKVKTIRVYILIADVMAVYLFIYLFPEG